MIRSIELRNIRSFKSERFMFTDGKNLIVGTNGAGKTTIIDCIGYVLFGYDDAVRKSEKIIDENYNEIGSTEKYGLVRYDTTGEAYIDIKFEKQNKKVKEATTSAQSQKSAKPTNEDENLIRVKVTFYVKKKGNPEQHWELWDEGKVVNTSNKREDVQRELWKLMGLEHFNRETFFQSILCIPQGEIVQPFEYRPAERLKYFDNIFGIAQKGELEEKYKLIDRYLENEMYSLNTRNSELKGKIANKNEINARHAENIKEKPNVENELNKVLEQLKELNEKLNHFNTLENKISTITQKIVYNHDAIERLKHQITNLETQIQEFQNKIRDFSDYEQIHQEFDTVNDIKNTIADLELKILNIEKQKSKAESDLDNGKKRKEQLESDLEMLTTAEPNYKKYQETESNLRSLKSHLEKRTQLLNSIESINLRNKELTQKIEILSTELQGYDEINKTVSELKKDSEELIKITQDKNNLEKEIKKDEKTLKDFGNKVCPFTSEKCAASSEVSSAISEKIEQKNKELREINKKIEELKIKTKDLNTKEQRLSDLNRKKAILEESKRDFEKLNKELEKLNQELEKYPDKAQEISNLEKELENLKEDYSTVITFQKQGKTIQNLQKDIQNTQKTMQKATETLNTLTSEFDSISEAFSKGNFITQLHSSMKTVASNKIFQEKAKNAIDQNKISGLPTQVKKSEDIKALKSLVLEYSNALQPFEGEFNVIKQIKEIKLPEKVNQKLQSESQLAEYLELDGKMKAELETLKKSYDPIEHSKIKTEYDQINEKKGSLQEKIKNLTTRIKEDTDMLAQIGQWEIEIAELDKKIELIKKQKDLNEKIKRSMASLTKMREKYINHVNREVQNINVEIGYPGIDIFWDPNYTIYIRKANTLLTINQLSGGQKVLYALMIRLAINKLFSKRFGLFILDEPTIHLDEESRKVLSNFIDKMEGIKQLIIVSHTDEFLASIDNEIKLIQNEYKTINPAVE